VFDKDKFEEEFIDVDLIIELKILDFVEPRNDFGEAEVGKRKEEEDGEKSDNEEPFLISLIEVIVFLTFT
jgi:hypothetical protein